MAVIETERRPLLPRSRPRNEATVISSPPETSLPKVPKVGIVLKSGGRAGAMFQTFALEFLEREFGISVLDPDVTVVGQSGGSIAMALTVLTGFSAHEGADLSRGWHPESKTRARFLHEAPNWREDFPITQMSAKEAIPRSFFAGVELVSNLSEPLESLRRNSWLRKHMRGGIIEAKRWEEDLKHVFAQWPRNNLFVLGEDWDNDVRVIMGPADAELPELERSVYEVTDPRTAIRASFSIPGVFTAPVINGRVVRDGTSGTDVDIPMALGCDHIIVIDPMVGQDMQRRRPRPGRGDERLEWIETDTAKAAEIGVKVFPITPSSPGLGYGANLMKVVHRMGVEQAAIESLRTHQPVINELAEALAFDPARVPQFGAMFQAANVAGKLELASAVTRRLPQRSLADSFIPGLVPA